LGPEAQKSKPWVTAHGLLNLSGSGRRCFSSLEAFPAEYRTPLSGAERYSGFPSALRTVGGRLDLGVTSGATFLALTFTGFAALGLVPEILVGEKLLFSRSEYEIGAAIDAFEYSILKLWHLPGSCFPIRYRTTLGKPLDPPY
jgi:hypothetical protein